MNLWNLAVGTAELMLCALCVIQILTLRTLDRRARVCLLCFCCCMLPFVGGNLVGQLLRGKPGAFIHGVLLAANCCEFLFSAGLAYIGARYLLALADPEKRLRRTRIVFDLLLGLHILLVAVSQFTGLLYTIGSDNLYRRAPLYPLSLLCPSLTLLICLVLLYRLRERLTRRERLAFCVYLLAPLAAIGIQPFFQGVYVIVQSTAVAVLTMYVFVLSEQTERYYRQEQEAERLKLSLMLSQIQPHFLYNSLGTIQALCRSDPVGAERAVGEFSQFLRHNMRSIESDRPIPFRQELSHAQNYLALQKLRFGDDLNVVYELECESFSLPTLTLQPLVENAVSHGIRRTESGRGTVAIRTRELEDRWELSVADDGAGFDPGQAASGAGSHVALSNIRSRLARVCGGSLLIESGPGKGTTATIRIPRTDVPKKS